MSNIHSGKIARFLVALDGTPPEPDRNKYWEHLKQVMKNFGVDPKTDLVSGFQHKWVVGSLSGARELNNLAGEKFGEGIWDNRAYRVQFGRFQNPSLGNGWLLVVNQLEATPAKPVSCKSCGRGIILDISGEAMAKACSGLGCGNIFCGTCGSCDCGIGVMSLVVGRYAE
jgi:hypothetical protein